MENIIHKSEKELVDGLESYLKHGYVEPNYINNDSFDESADQAGEYLRALLLMDKKLVETYYKKIIESEVIWNDFFKSLCLSNLLLSESEWEYAFNYLNENSEHLSIPVLKEALFYFYCAKNDPEAHAVPKGLLKKLQARYKEIKNEPDVEFYNLNEEYDNFAKVYGFV